MLSPSNAQESISLKKEYKGFPEAHLSHCFLGFDSDLSSLFLEHVAVIKEFYDHVVDENQNQLNLACFYDFNSEWFFLCCKIADILNKLLVTPLCLALGIDKYKKVRSEH